MANNPPPTENRLGVEINGIYDGVLFWFDTKTGETARRFDDQWYEERFRHRDKGIDQVMADWVEAHAEYFRSTEEASDSG